MSGNTCGCGRPSRDAFLCTDCRGALAIDLTALAAFIPELGNAVALRARTSAHPDTRPAPPPGSAVEAGEARILPPHLRTASGPIALPATGLPLDLAAADLLGVARNTISTWCRHLCETRGLDFAAVVDGWPAHRPAAQASPPAPLFGPVHLVCSHASCWRIKASTTPPKPPRRPAGETRSSDQRMLTWLLRNLSAIAQDEAADQLAGDMRWLRQRIETAIDNAEPRVFAGTCNATSARTEIIGGTVYITPTVCGHTLLADPDLVTVTCESCGTGYDVADRQAEMLEHMRHSLMRAAHIVDVLRAYGLDITLERLKNWIGRDRAEFDEGRRRNVAYPPILMASATELGPDGLPYLEQDLDPDGKPRVNEHGRPIMRLGRGRPLYRLGDVQDRVLALKEITAERSAAGRKDTA